LSIVMKHRSTSVDHNTKSVKTTLVAQKHGVLAGSC
jgi:hypothetical protein